MGDLPRPGIELVSLAMQGGFLTTGPSGKPTLSFCCGRRKESVESETLSFLRLVILTFFPIFIPFYLTRKTVFGNLTIANSLVIWHHNTMFWINEVPGTGS